MALWAQINPPELEVWCGVDFPRVPIAVIDGRSNLRGCFGEQHPRAYEFNNPST